MDRNRLENDLRAVVNLLLLTAPPELLNLDLGEHMRKLGAAGPPLFRMLGLPTSGTWDLRATAYAACSAVTALPDDQLRTVLELVAWEIAGLLGHVIATETAMSPEPPRAPTPPEWDAIAVVLNAVRSAVSS